CPEGFVPATPPLNPQLGCLPDTITSDPGVEPGPVIPPGGCPEGFVPATPPLNPQLGCLPESETADPGVQPGEDETEVPDDSVVDETADGDETTLSAVPAERQPAENGDGGDEGEDEGDEGEGNDENGNDRGGNEDVIQ
ncbi:MAG: hypothetical protein ACRD8Z_17385, partial [Nitrososphaeraceae archaeon]